MCFFFMKFVEFCQMLFDILHQDDCVFPILFDGAFIDHIYQFLCVDSTLRPRKKCLLVMVYASFNRLHCLLFTLLKISDQSMIIKDIGLSSSFHVVSLSGFKAVMMTSQCELGSVTFIFLF